MIGGSFNEETNRDAQFKTEDGDGKASGRKKGEKATLDLSETFVENPFKGG